MLADYLIAPSLNALFVTGLILLTIIILMVKNYSSIIRLDYYQKIILLTSLSIAFATHGLVHLGLEERYNFNPYNWI
jgi:hypothetical protein